MNRADTKVNLEDYQGAVADFTKAIELEADFGHAFVGRGHAKILLEDYHGAIVDLTKALEIPVADPDDAIMTHSDAYYNRGIAREKLNDLDGACSDWRKATEADPEYKDPAELLRQRC